MKKWVVDKNYLESEKLTEFLASDLNNRAVLTDFSAIEALAGNPAKNMQKTLAIVRRYPKQVLILKGAADMVALGPINPDTRFELVDWEATRGFEDFCRDMDKAFAGEPTALDVFRQRAVEAQEHLAMMETKMVFMANAFDDIGRLVGPEALRARREKTKLPLAAGKKIVNLICHLADSLFASDSGVPKIKGTIADARHYYTFRYATAGVILALTWAQRGGAIGARPEKLRNDFVDLSYLTAATYFDGLLTDDEKMWDVYAETVFMIEDFFSGAISRRART